MSREQGKCVSPQGSPLTPTTTRKRGLCVGPQSPGSPTKSEDVTPGDPDDKRYSAVSFDSFVLFESFVLQLENQAIGTASDVSDYQDRTLLSADTLASFSSSLRLGDSIRTEYTKEDEDNEDNEDNDDDDDDDDDDEEKGAGTTSDNTDIDNMFIELIDTETSYVASMSLLNQEYLDPLQKHLVGILPSYQGVKVGSVLSRLSGVIYRIINLSNYYAKELKVCLRKPKKDENGEADDPVRKILFFTQSIFQDIHSIYNSYVLDYEESCKHIKALAQSKPGVANFLSSIQQCGRTNFQSIEDLLILPIQRITRYVMIFGGLTEAIKSKPNPANYNMVEMIHRGFKAIAHNVNEGIDKRNAWQKLLQISLKLSVRFGSSFEILVNGRALVKSGYLFKSCRNAVRSRMFYLFNDVFLYADSKGYVKHFYYPSEIRIRDTNDPNTFSWAIHGTSKSFIVCAENQESKDDWMQKLDAFSCKKKDSIESLPVWEPDAGAHECTICKRPFGLFHRKHHCRFCGKILCSRCSKYQIPMSSTQTYARACLQCKNDDRLSACRDAGGIRAREQSPSSESSYSTSASSFNSSVLAIRSQSGRSDQHPQVAEFSRTNAVWLSMHPKPILPHNPKRVLIKTGPFQLYHDADLNTLTIFFFLFNDCLIIASDALSNRWFVIDKVTEIELHEPSRESVPNGFRIRVSKPAGELTVSAPNESEKIQWLQLLESGQFEVLDESNLVPSNLVEESVACSSGCGTSFGLRRRYPCRLCKLVFCSTCAPHRYGVFNKEDINICSNCNFSMAITNRFIYANTTEEIKSSCCAVCTNPVRTTRTCPMCSFQVCSVCIGHYMQLSIWDEVMQVCKSCYVLGFSKDEFSIRPFQKPADQDGILRKMASFGKSSPNSPTRSKLTKSSPFSEKPADQDGILRKMASFEKSSPKSPTRSKLTKSSSTGINSAKSTTPILNVSTMEECSIEAPHSGSFSSPLNPPSGSFSTPLTPKSGHSASKQYNPEMDL